MVRDKQQVKSTLEKFEAGVMSRREVMRRLGYLGVSTAVANFVLRSPLGATRAFAAISGPEEWA